jgi:hypothetical protein
MTTEVSAKTLKTLADNLAKYNTHPVYNAVMPLKREAMEFAEKNARERVAKMLAKLEAAGWDAQIVAPFPNSLRTTREQYRAGTAKYYAYRSIVRHAQATRRMNDPEIVVASAERIAKFVSDAMEFAAYQYDSFVFKLVGKIGDCDTATLDGSHVWGESFLTVAKGETVELWKTQQIYNCSKLGKWFPQWPSRKVKGRG